MEFNSGTGLYLGKTWEGALLEENFEVREGRCDVESREKRFSRSSVYARFYQSF